MSSPSPPKPRKVNPYEGINSDADVYRAQQALGINKIKKDKHMAKINDYLLEERWEKEGQRGSFENSLKVAERKGIIEEGDRTTWALDQVLGVEDERNYAEDARESAKQMEEMQQGFADQQKAMQLEMQETQAAQLAQQQEAMKAQYDQSRADQAANAEAQKAMMEEMMNQPVYMPKQQQMPVVQRPEVRNDPIPPAPNPPSPMNIAAPPAPELTSASNRMGIVKTSRSLRTRSRRATRGTSSLTN